MCRAIDSCMSHIPGWSSYWLDTSKHFVLWCCRSGWGVSLWGCNRRKEHDRTVVTIDGFEDVPTVRLPGFVTHLNIACKNLQ